MNLFDQQEIHTQRTYQKLKIKLLKSKEDIKLLIIRSIS